jgi:hypothetical protein
VSISEIAGVGDLEEHGEGYGGQRWAAAVSAGGRRGQWWVRAVIRELLQAYPTIPATVIAEPGRVAVLDPDAERSGGRVAAGVFAAGSVVEDQLCRW